MKLRTYSAALDVTAIIMLLALMAGGLLGLSPFAAASEGSLPAESSALDAKICAKIKALFTQCLSAPCESLSVTRRGEKNPTTDRPEDIYLVNKEHVFCVDSETGIVTGYGLRRNVKSSGASSSSSPVTNTDIYLTVDEVFRRISPCLSAFGLPTAPSEYEDIKPSIAPDSLYVSYRYKYDGIMCLGCYASVNASLKTGELLSITTFPVSYPPTMPCDPISPCKAIDAVSRWFKDCPETRKDKYRIKLGVADCNSLTQIIAPHVGMLDNRKGSRTDLMLCWSVPFELSEYYSGSWHGPWHCEAYVSSSTGTVIGDSVSPSPIK